MVAEFLLVTVVRSSSCKFHLVTLGLSFG